MRSKLMKRLLSLALLLSTAVLSYAQNVTVKGQVWDPALNEAVIGANVSLKGAKIGTSTDLDGNFTISAAPGSEIVISCIGYKDEVIKVRQNTSAIRVELQTDSEFLEEIVVVGYGQQKKASSVGSIATAKGEDLLKTGNVTTVSEALQGQMAGVISINNSSKPGDDAASIFIRGKGTWQSASPLVLVDGIERNFNDVDVNEIESISVLKDASATAVYGVKGANGVILLTTKRGENKKTSVSFSSNFGLKTPTTDFDFAPYLTSMQVWNEAAANSKQWEKTIPSTTIKAWENAYQNGLVGPYSDYFPEVDWWGETLKWAGTQQNYNLNIRGGSDKVNYFVSFGYLNDGDIFDIEKQPDFDPRFWYKRYNWRTNLDYKITPTTTLSVNIAGSMGYRNQSGYRDAENGDSYIFQPIYQAPTNLFPIKYSDGNWGSDPTGAYNVVSQLSYQGQRQYNSFKGFYDISLKQDLSMITKGLSAKASISYTTSYTKQAQIFKALLYNGNAAESSKLAIIRYYRAYDYANPYYDASGKLCYPQITDDSVNIFPSPDVEQEYPVGATYDTFSGYGREIYYEGSLSYNRTFGNHTVTALGVFNRRISTSTGSGTTVQFPSYEEAWVGRATYNYKEKYLFEVNAAYTGSEKFAPGKRFGLFPSYSIGWRVTEEPWMKTLKQKGLTNLKLRYSYGIVGSDIGAGRFNYIQIFNSGGNVTFGKDQSVSYGPLYTEGALAYEDATWETATKQNLGIEATLFKKLRATVDLFDEHRDGILMSRKTTAPWMGAGLPAANIGKTKNHGLDLQVSWNDDINKKLHYFLTFNFGTSESRVIFRDDPNDLDDYLKDAGKPIGTVTKYIATGNLTSLDDIFNYTTSRINNGAQSTLVPGDLAYIDYNCDGMINSLDQVPMANVTFPLTSYSLTFGFNYKGFGLNAMLYAATNVYKEQIAQFLWDFPSNNIKAQPNTLDRWTPADAGRLDVVRPSVHIVNNYNSQGSTYSFVSHSFLRLKNVELSYQLPKKLTKQLKISSAQFYLNGNNIFTITGVDSRRDPETSSNSVYPIVRRYNTGVRLSF